MLHRLSLRNVSCCQTSRNTKAVRFYTSVACILFLCYTEEEIQIVSGLKNTDIFAGESATFTCELSRSGTQKAQWWLDGSPLHNSPANEISTQDGTIHTLTLKDLGLNDSGTVTFRAGSLISSAKLLIKGISGFPCQATAMLRLFLCHWTPNQFLQSSSWKKCINH